MVYEERLNRYQNQTKFTMPALKAGSIYELTYTIKSNYFDDPPTWNFQGEYPCLWSEYEVTIPPHVSLYDKNGCRGDNHFDVNTTESTVFESLDRSRKKMALETISDMTRVKRILN